MALRQGTLVWGTLKIADDTLLIPLADQEDICGGYHVVNALTDRNALPGFVREAGMIARVWNDPTPENDGEYILVPGTVDDTLTNNGNWVQVTPPNAVTNKYYIAFNSTEVTVTIDWTALLATFGNAPAIVTAYVLQDDGTYEPESVSWSIDAYPATTLLVQTNNETGFLIVM